MSGRVIPVEHRAGVIERVAELLEVTYRSADLGNLSDPLAESIYILLSRQTQEGVYQRQFAALRARWPTWLDVLAAPHAELESILAEGGLHRQRSRQIQALLAVVRDDNRERGQGPFAVTKRDLTLDFLREQSDAEVEAYLRKLPGIGPKSARCVMSYSLGRDVFAVDTHVRRVFRHLGLAESRGIKADHDPFQSAVPPKLRQSLHMNLIHHGREVCHSENPACQECVLVSWCQSGRIRAGRSNPQAPVVVDLFAGAGGLSTGFQQEGFRTALAVELDRNAAQTYRANHPGVPVLEMDVRRLTGQAIRDAAAGAAHVDAVLAGPPCQGYSAAGKRQPDDAKNSLYREVSRVASQLDAEFVVMENVLGARQVSGKRFVELIMRSLRRRGFRPAAYDLNALEFDVPQNRRRLVFIGHKSSKCDHPVPAPSVKPVESRHKFLRRKLAGLPEYASGIDAEYVVEDGRVLLNASTMRHSEKVIRKIRRIKPGKGPISYRRLSEDAARTLIAGHRALPVHPWLHRTISVREAARIQGFSDDFVFCGPRSAQPLQVANAVPPPMAAGIARAVLRAKAASQLARAARRVQVQSAARRAG